MRINLIHQLIFLLILIGCKQEIQVSLVESSNLSDVVITNVSFANDQIIINGNNLNKASNLSLIQNNSPTEKLIIKSKSSNQLVLEARRNMTLMLDHALNLIISNASASASFSIDVSLCNSLIAGKPVNCTVTPNDNDVLTYDSTSDSWIPSSSGGGAGLSSCPSGFTSLGPVGAKGSVCMQITANPANGYFNAINGCLDADTQGNGYAHLCTLHEWQIACRKGVHPGQSPLQSFLQQQWVYESGAMTGVALTMGVLSSCNIYAGNNTSDNYPYRCCL